MFEWSEEDLMVRDAVRSFVDKEIRPHSDELESGQMPPYDILRKLMTSFGVDAMAREGLEKELDAEAAGESKPKGSGGGMMNSMALILNMELAGASLGMVVSMGVSVGLTVSTIRSKGTLAQKKRWLPELVTLEKVGAWAITEPDSGSDALGGMKTTVRRDGDGYILNGQKTFITNGGSADTLVVVTKFFHVTDLVALADLTAGELTRLSVERAVELGRFRSWTPARTVTQLAAIRTDSEDPT